MEQFHFFWRGPLSQWPKSEFFVNDIKYNCAEQWMMAKKAELFEDFDTLDQIMSESSPKEQKALGRTVQNFDLPIWEANARRIVYRGNFHKFYQNDEFREALFATKGKTLVEASPVDRIWGIGLAEDNPDALDRTKWLGKNWLGETLTKVRDDLLSIFDV